MYSTNQLSSTRNICVLFYSCPLIAIVPCYKWHRLLRWHHGQSRPSTVLAYDVTACI